MEYRARRADDDDAQRKGQKRQIGDVDGDEEDEHHALPGKGQHVGRLRKGRGLLRDGGDDLCAADLVERKQLRAPHLVHQPYPQSVDDGFDLDGGGDQDVVLGLDEEQQRGDEQRGRQTLISPLPAA